MEGEARASYVAANHHLTIHYICLYAWVFVCRRRLHFHATGQPIDETLLGRLIRHISETWQDKASQTAVGPSPICLLLSSN